MNSGYQASVPMNLPPGWECKLDPTTRRYFYIDHVNKKTQWTAPSIPGYGSSRPPPPTQSKGQQLSALSQPRNASSNQYTSSASSVSSENSMDLGSSSSSKNRSKTGANAMLQRRLQLMFNANSPSEKEIVNDVLIALNNNEKQAIATLNGLSVFKNRGGASNVSKPQMATSSPGKNMTEKEKSDMISRLQIAYSGDFSKLKLEEIAAKHDYEMSLVKKELNKIKDDNAKKGSDANVYASPDYNASTDTSSFFVPMETPRSGQGTKDAKAAPRKTKHNKQTVKPPQPQGTATLRAFHQSNMDLPSSAAERNRAKRDNTSTRVTSATSATMGARSNSEYLSSSRARGPDPSLLSGSRVSVSGSRGCSVGPSAATGMCGGLARGPSCVIQGPNASLLCK